VKNEVKGVIFALWNSYKDTTIRLRMQINRQLFTMKGYINSL